MNDYDTTSATRPGGDQQELVDDRHDAHARCRFEAHQSRRQSISVGGKAEFLGTSVLNNSGYLTLAGGGDFASGTSITNSGTIELSGGTLTTLTEIHNAGGTLQADADTTLIVDTATVDGGTVAILGTLELDGTSLIENGTLNNFGAVNVKGAAEFAKETVANTRPARSRSGQWRADDRPGLRRRQCRQRQRRCQRQADRQRRNDRRRWCAPSFGCRRAVETRVAPPIARSSICRRTARSRTTVSSTSPATRC